MKSTTLAKSGAALAASAALALATALPASAHVSVSASSTAAGSSSLLSFTVPHGCEGSPTTSIDIALPEEILGAIPTVLAGWTVEKVMQPLADLAPGSHGEDTSERVGHVVYTSTGAGLPEGYRAQFDVQVTLPDLAAGTELGFRIVQSCVDGQAVWEGDEDQTLVLTEAAAGDGHGGISDGPADEPATAPVDVLARVLGAGALVVGAVGLVLAIALPRRGAAA